MAESVRDDNRVASMTGVLDTNGTTIVRIKANPTTHIIDALDAETGSDFGGDNAIRDNNGVPVLLALSSSDGTTPVPLYVGSTGQIMIKST